MEIDVAVKFTEEEQKALNTISNIDCTKIPCRYCPFGTSTANCIKGVLRKISEEYSE